MQHKCIIPSSLFPSICSFTKMSKDFEDGAETTIDHNASEIVSMPIIVLLLILVLSVFERLNHKVDRSSNGKRTNRMMIGVIISNFVFTSFVLMRLVMCMHCAVQEALVIEARWIMKWFNLQFMIHRAKLAQGMTPILSKKWFNKILPRSITFFTVIFMFFTLNGVRSSEAICHTYRDIDSIQACWMPGGFDNRNGGIKAYATFMLGFDFVLTTFLLILFVVPLYRVYSTDLGALNDNQLRQRKKLRTLLIWSVTMCFINQVTSIFFFLSMFADSAVIWVLSRIGKFDPAINVWTSWLMITRNRQYLRQLMRCRCCQTQQLQRSFTDVSDMQSISRTDSGSKWFLRMFTRSQSSIPVRSMSNVQLTIEEDPNVVNA